MLNAKVHHSTITKTELVCLIGTVAMAKLFLSKNMAGLGVQSCIWTNQKTATKTS